MEKTISIMTEEFENEKIGEKVEGITIMVDGVFKEVLDIIKAQNSQYKSNVHLIHDALIKGLESIRKSI